MNRYDRWENYFHPDTKASGIGCALVISFLATMAVVLFSNWAYRKQFQEIDRRLESIEHRLETLEMRVVK